MIYDLDRQPSKIRNSLKKQLMFSSYEKFKKILKRLFVEPFKTAFYRTTAKSLCVCFESYFIVLLREKMSISWIFTIHIKRALKRYIGFAKQDNRIPTSFDSVLTRQTSEKVAYKPGLDCHLECFLPSTFGPIISALPETFPKGLKQGGYGLHPPSPHGPYAYETTAHTYM